MLPTIKNLTDFQALDLRHPAFIQATLTLMERYGLCGELRTPSNGSLPVVLVGTSHVIKFFPALFFEAHEREIKALVLLSHIKVPRLVAQGEHEGWRFVVMSQLAGASLKTLWPELSAHERQALGFETGQLLHEMHQLTLAPQEQGAWQSFLTEQNEKCVEHQRSKGTSEHWLAQIPAFLARVSLPQGPICFLHTEIMQEHVFAQKTNTALELTGFIDFEPSMRGHAEYDFASVGLFLSRGEPTILRSFFAGYGNLSEAASSEFKRRIMAYTLLHRYSRLKWYLEFMPSVETLEEAAQKWWAID